MIVAVKTAVNVLREASTWKVIDDAAGFSKLRAGTIHRLGHWVNIDRAVATSDRAAKIDCAKVRLVHW